MSDTIGPQRSSPKSVSAIRSEIKQHRATLVGEVQGTHWVGCWVSHPECAIAAVRRCRTALEAIVIHQELIGGGLAVLSVTRKIAQGAIDHVGGTTKLVKDD